MYGRLFHVTFRVLTESLADVLRMQSARNSVTSLLLDPQLKFHHIIVYSDPLIHDSVLPE